MLRLWNNEILANLSGVKETIADELSRAIPTQPPPSRGRETLSRR
jgi:hypothetical protein